MRKIALFIPLISLFAVYSTAYAQYQIKVASSADRTTWCCVNGQSTPAQVLPDDGTYFMVTGEVYVFVEPATGVQSVSFYLRASDLEFPTTPEQVENSAPWDFKGGATTAANPWVTYSTPNGLYVIRADLTLTDGSVQSIVGGIGITNTSVPDPVGDLDPQQYDTSVTLRWTAPTENMDGSPIPPPPHEHALAGFRLYWGTTSGNYPWVQDIPDPLATSYTLEGIPPGTWVFVGTAYNEWGAESPYSNEAVKVVTEGGVPPSDTPRPNPPDTVGVNVE